MTATEEILATDGSRWLLSFRCTMIQTVEAIIDENGEVRLLQPVRVHAARRALVTILDEQPTVPISETALLSEAALAEDWNRPEEDEAWSHLQWERSS